LPGSNSDNPKGKQARQQSGKTKSINQKPRREALRICGPGGGIWGRPDGLFNYDT